MSRLAPTVTSLARHTMRTAFEELDRTIMPSDSKAFRATTLEQVRAAALDIEGQLAARGSLRNTRRLSPLLKGLEHYAKVMEVLCNGTPFLPWIWAPISLILRVASEYVDAFEQLMKGYHRIASALGRFEILSHAFTGDPDFQQTLAVFYADILEFHKHAYKFVKRNGWKLLFLTSWGRFERRFDNIIDDLERHGKLIDLEANARNIVEAHRMRRELREWREESLKDVQRVENERTAKQYASILSWLKIDEEAQLAIFDTISDERKKFPGTCDWILHNAKIKGWLQRQPDTPILWLQGSPGTGKSMIASQLVAFLRRGHHFAVAHFCTGRYSSSTKYEQILKTLMLQLLRRNGELVAHVYQDCLLGKKSPTILLLERLVVNMFNSITDGPRQTEYVWLIIDGLDECEMDKQARLAYLMSRMSSKSVSNGGTVCKVFFTSRPSPNLPKTLRKVRTISLADEGENLATAIQQYASRRLQSLHERFRQMEMETEEIEELERQIANKAAGMFLYARLLLDYLTMNIFHESKEITISIQQLPPTLNEFYCKILTQITARLDQRSVERIGRMFSWVAFARRPLMKLEFLSAVSFSAGDTQVDRLIPAYVLEICSPLIEERKDSSIVFIHTSLTEFLQSAYSNVVINKQEALKEHGVATITCLISGLRLFRGQTDESTRIHRLVKGLHGFHIYATEFWTEYLLDSASERDRIDHGSRLFSLAMQLAYELEQSAERSNLSHSSPDEIDGRIHALQQYEPLYRLVLDCLRCRSEKRLELELFISPDQDENANPPERIALDGISALLNEYQRTVQEILNSDFYPGISAEQLRVFKNQFRTSAYTCRLRSCPRATLGFDSDQLRYEHEITHTGGFQCIHTGCHYPPLRSAKLLEVHVGTIHRIKPPQRSIRSQPRDVPMNPGRIWRSGNTNNQPKELPANSNPPTDFAHILPEGDEAKITALDGSESKHQILLMPEDIEKLQYLSHELRMPHHITLTKFWYLIRSNPKGSSIHTKAVELLEKWSQELILEERAFRQSKTIEQREQSAKHPVGSASQPDQTIQRQLSLQLPSPPTQLAANPQTWGPNPITGSVDEPSGDQHTRDYKAVEEVDPILPITEAPWFQKPPTNVYKGPYNQEIRDKFMSIFGESFTRDKDVGSADV